MAQVEECLPSKHEALSSNRITAQTESMPGTVVHSGVSSKPAQAKLVRLCLKHKRGGHIVQVVEHLPRKYQALGLISSIVPCPPHPKDSYFFL
jgi:hypothetical protein